MVESRSDAPRPIGPRSVGRPDTDDSRAIVPPKGIPEPDIKAAEAHAQSMVDRLLREPGDDGAVTDLESDLSALLSRASVEIEQLRGRLGRILDIDLTPEAPRSIPDYLNRMDRTFRDMDPFVTADELTAAVTAGGVGRLLRKPASVGALLNDLGGRWASMQTYLHALLQSLEGGANRLMGHQESLEIQYAAFKSLRNELRLRIHGLSVMVGGLSRARETDAAGGMASRVESLRGTLDGWIDRLGGVKETMVHLFVSLRQVINFTGRLRYAIRSLDRLTRFAVEDGAHITVSDWKEGEILKLLKQEPDLIRRIKTHDRESPGTPRIDPRDIAMKPLIRFRDLIRRHGMLMDHMDFTRDAVDEYRSSLRETLDRLDRTGEGVVTGGPHREAA